MSLTLTNGYPFPYQASVWGEDTRIACRRLLAVPHRDR
ncbi:hypothetical protein SAMN05518800_1867 [Variovorax sp. YR752]|nr:hypothetical protein SAMN05518800_1867 [Variovorax sp. YR752]